MSVTNFIKAVKKGQLDHLGDLYAKCNRPVTHEEISGRSLYDIAAELHSVALF